MRAIAERLRAPGAAAAALAAGCDLLLVCAHLTDTVVSLDLARDLLAALDDGTLPAELEEVSARRVADLLAAAPQHAVEPLPEGVFARHRRLLV
jgi:beta-N-acetylhexosaminidase